MSNQLSVPTPTDRAELIKLYHKSLGASEVGIVLGMSKYKSPHQLWLEKTAAEPVVTPQNEWAEVGVFFEDTVAQYYAKKTGDEIENDKRVCYHPDHPFLRATVDRFITKHNNPKPHEVGKGILEIKMASDYAADAWENVVPIPYWIQVQQQFDVTGLKWGYIALLISIREFKIIPIQRDDEFIEKQRKILVDFWHENVEKRIPPAWSYLDLDAIHARAGTSVAVSADLAEKARLLVFLKQLKGKAEKAYKELSNGFKLYMSENEVLTINGETLATWKPVKSRVGFDVKRFEKEHPELYPKYLTEGPPQRKFMVKDKAVNSLPPSVPPLEIPQVLQNVKEEEA